MSENLNTSNTQDDNFIATPPAPIAGEDNSSSSSSRILKHEKHLIEMRRARVLELWSQGWSQPRIADEVHVVQSTIHEDISFLKQQAREQLKNFVTSELPNTIARTKVSLDLVTQKLWATVAQAERDGDYKIKLQALSQINQVEAQKIEIVSNLGIVDSVVGAAEQRQQAQPVGGSNEPSIEEPEEAEESTSESGGSAATKKSLTSNDAKGYERETSEIRAKAIPLDSGGDD